MEPAVPEGKVVITAALTGGVHDKSANPNLPEQPAEIIEQALACREAGAAIVHCHARTPEGRPTCDPAIFRQIHDGIARQSDVIVQLTTGGGLGLSTEERFGVISLAPEMASLNMGMVNFIIKGEEFLFPNMRSDIRAFAEAMNERGVKPELELYDMSMIDEAIYFIDHGLLSPPWVVNFVLDTPSQGGLPGRPENLVEMYRRVSERIGIGPDAAQINVTSCGDTQLPLTTMAMAMGLNVRVGMEDNVLFRPGELVSSNAQLVERTVRIARELNLEPATPDEAREFFAMERRDAVRAGAA